MAAQARVLPIGGQRRVLSPIDLRTSEERRGLSKSQRNIQAITGIMQLLGQAEQKRRERQQLDSIATAIAAGATSIEAINAEVNKAKQTQFSGGISGILQRIGGGFQPSPGGGVGQGIQQAIVGQGLKQALAPKPLLTGEEQREGALIKAGIKPKAGTGPTVTAPSKQQKQRDRDLAIIGNKKKSEFQKVEARKRIDKDPSQPRNPVPSGGTYDEFLNDTDKVKGKFGKKAYNKTLAKVEDEARTQGLDPKGIKRDFDRWWDARVKNERTGAFGGGFTRNVTTPRSEFQDVSNEDISQLSDEELQSIATGK